MNVELLSCTPDALNLLLRTKNTRLKFDSDPATWSDEARAEHLEYMRNTIKSSWEFVDYTFRISGVTRAFTHQLVRTRTGSYAQESQRTVDVRKQVVLKPESVSEQYLSSEYWDKAVGEALLGYESLIDDCSIPVQDARGLLPTNMTTEIVAKFSLRTLHEMAKVRLCTRTQGEYQQAFRKMRECVIGEHAWASEFLDVQCVATGTCAFPNYGRKSCKFWDDRLDHSALQNELKARYWSGSIQVAQPLAVGGKSTDN